MPTTAEVDLPDVVIYGYNAIQAPAATPRPIVDKLNAAVNQVLADAGTIARGRTLGLRIGGGPPEQLKQTMDKGDRDLCQGHQVGEYQAGLNWGSGGTAHDPPGQRQNDRFDFAKSTGSNFSPAYLPKFTTIPPLVGYVQFPGCCRRTTAIRGVFQYKDVSVDSRPGG